MGIFSCFTGVCINPTTVLVCALVALIIHRLISRDKRNLPPFPNLWLPVIGHMHYMKADMRQTCRQLRAQLGDVYSLQLGSRLAIIVGHYSTLKEAFVKQGETFADRPPLYSIDVVVQGRRNTAPFATVNPTKGALSTATECRTEGFVNRNGMPWKEHRRFVLSTLKDLGMGRRPLESRIQTEATALVKVMKETNESPFNPRPMVNTTVTNIVSLMLFGDTFQHGDPRITEVLKLVEENMRCAPVAGILNFFPFLRLLPGDIFGMRKLISNDNKIHEFCRDIVLEHQQRTKTKASDDLTSAYLLAMEEKNQTGEETTFSIDLLGGTIMDLFIAGSETTTTVINWSILCLAIYSEIQTKLHAEIMECFGKETVPSFADRVQVPYVEAFYMEILRYCNLAPLLIPHAVSHDTKLLGYTIPKEAIVFVDMDSVAIDPEIWGDPENFRPERFIDENGKLSRKEEFIFFFFGKRSCIGESLARMELFLILITLVQTFQFVCPENQTLSLEKLDGLFGVTHGPKIYEIVAKKRR